ncbi:MAG: hypothetical protein LQ347_006134 [Umbilicaria vellea]|nr:MAG: hypothetical protein LQ347_006134 [Umbilicaria vellea]
MTDLDLHHFQSIPWCAKVLADPDFTIILTRFRTAKEDTEDSLFAETLQTDKTIRACLSLYSKSDPSGNESDLKIQRVRTLVSLGDGVNGYHDIAHGGFVATLLDQGMGILVEENLYNGSGKDAFTAYLNVKYRRPVLTPGVYLLTATYTKVVLRKQFMKAALEDGEGTVYAEAEALFIENRPKL